MSKLVYTIARLISLLPLRALYCISDFTYFIMYILLGYRKKVVRKNLTLSFPDKSEKELRDIERKFYHWFCDYFFESLKLLDFTPETIKEHLEFRNVDQIEECFDNNQHAAIMLGHYCNWEWLSSVHLYFTHHPEAVSGLIYHPLRNDAFDDLFLKIRSNLGGVCIKKNLILRYFARYRKENRMTIFGYIADQTPKWENIHLWLDFLHQNTPVFTGTERIARSMKNAVFFCDMERPCRGKYIATFHKLTDNIDELNEYDLTKEFFRRLETTINRQPEFYLWSHNRWKRSYDEWLRMQKENPETTNTNNE